MKNIIVITSTVLTACCTEGPTREQPVAVTPAQEQLSPVASIKPVSIGLSDLEAMTFSCPQAGLNAAARAAAKVPSQGHYQFAYFKIINDTHHSIYQVHFKSNYQTEADLEYCVSIYCQQGHDPTPSVSLISKEPHPTAANKASAAHSADCGDHEPLMQKIESKRRLKKR